MRDQTFSQLRRHQEYLENLRRATQKPNVTRWTPGAVIPTFVRLARSLGSYTRRGHEVRR